ncbi:glycosyl transferase family 1 [Fluviicoccus keumensis]|uniref:Glycosyl transferase family 1 n=1 Tax=Fluviicoccus keumensis TaxID=1435465 RepID=A0A4Q7Z8M7_9GAMM|nr:glycosyltransferase family 4 protein [Fluviicoccus keumensis]RZU46840.1 glycosyl transferase family 1 [Fluviicoccus keumensis]
MKVLFFFDTPPFPPRNGVTIPSSAFIELLMQKHDVDFVFLKDINDESENGFFNDTRKQYPGKFFTIQRSRKGSLARMLQELTLSSPSFLSWNYLNPTEISDIPFDLYDVFFTTPISALDIPLKHQKAHQKTIAAISDCYTSVLASSATKLSMPWKILQSLRVILMSRIESSLLLKCSCVIVQTQKDINWLSRIGGNRLSQKAVAMSNGVNDRLINTPTVLSTTSKTVLFVANFSDPLYRNNLDWFYSNVWPKVISTHQQAILRIAGKGLELSPLLVEKLAKDTTVHISGFVPDIIDVYKDTSLVVAPIFKNYGFINKVGEAFSLGLTVVGDASAFNGLEDSLETGIGFQADSPTEFSSTINSLLSSPEKLTELSSKTKQYAIAKLSWQSRLAPLERLLTQ